MCLGNASRWRIARPPRLGSGSSSAAGAASGSGLGPRNIDHVVGVCKAYSTRVGNGPFPSEFDPRKYLGPARDAMKQVCLARMEAFGMAGQGSRVPHVGLDAMAGEYAALV